MFLTSQFNGLRFDDAAVALYVPGRLLRYTSGVARLLRYCDAVVGSHARRTLSRVPPDFVCCRLSSACFGVCGTAMNNLGASCLHWTGARMATAMVPRCCSHAPACWWKGSWLSFWPTAVCRYAPTLHWHSTCATANSCSVCHSDAFAVVAKCACFCVAPSPSLCFA